MRNRKIGGGPRQKGLKQKSESEGGAKSHKERKSNRERKSDR